MKKLTQLLLVSTLIFGQFIPVIAQEAEVTDNNTPIEVPTPNAPAENNDHPQTVTVEEPTEPAPSKPSEEPAPSQTSSVEATPVSEEVALPESESTPAATHAPVYSQEHIQARPIQYSNDPEDYSATTAITSPVANIQRTNSNHAYKEIKKDDINKKSLFDEPYLAFNTNIFLREADADAFIKQIKEDPQAGDRFVLKKIKNENDSVLVTIEYADNAKEEGRPILLYVETGFDTEKEASDYGAKYLTIMPDLFFDAEVFEVGGQYHVVFGIYHTANTLAFDYRAENGFEIFYSDERKEFTYHVSANEAGEFVDPIPEAVEEAFPGQFTFKEKELADGTKEVTMTPVKEESDASAEASSAESESDESSQTAN